MVPVIVALLISGLLIGWLWWLARATRPSWTGLATRWNATMEQPVGRAGEGVPIEPPAFPRRLQWNWAAVILGPLWYLLKGLWVHFMILSGVLLLSFGVLLPFVWLYCALKADEDLLEFRLARHSVY
ncbi:MAG: DUF2628 domain-containing protein [Armatimonadetes bacterium]|nr:DUF2628 domain-containing protein [Armatimonadota bacterium]